MSENTARRYRDLDDEELILETLTSETPFNPDLLHEVERRGLQHEACRLSLRSIILARAEEHQPKCARLENWKAIRYLVERARERADGQLTPRVRGRLWDAMEALLDAPQREHPVCDLDRILALAFAANDETGHPRPPLR